jgi:methyl-accepting chemotaxis protein
MDNCWEVVKCKREAECPAYPDHGRECYAVTSTMCRGEKQGTYEDKIEKCRKQCAFYKKAMDGGDRADLWS